MLSLSVHASRALQNPDDVAITAFSGEHLSIKDAPLTVWKLSDALPLTRFHNIVDYFATRLSSTTLTAAASCLREPPSKPIPTDTEVHRVQRALYRFQLYCNMFGADGEDVREPDFQRDVFFSHFSTWEWLDGHELPERLVGQDYTAHWRLWRYVFWDMTRLEDSGVLQGEINNPRAVHELAELTQPASHLALSKSQEVRRTIEQRGGSSLWSFEDQSKVALPAASDNAPKYSGTPRSLEEAKDMFRDFKLR